MRGVTRGIAALCIVFCLGLILGGMDRRDAQITQQHVAAATERKFDLKPLDRIWINDPVCPPEDEADARVNQRVHLLEEGETRCYWKRKPR